MSDGVAVMPNAIERLFRAIFLYTTLYWVITGLWGIPQTWVMWGMWKSHGMLSNNELYCLGVLILVYGSQLVVGIIGISYFRELADRQYRQIPDIADRSEPKWHDTGIFATLLCTLTGLYCLDIGFMYFSYLEEPLMLLGAAIRDRRGGTDIFHSLYHNRWDSMLLPIHYLFCGIVLLVCAKKIALWVVKMVEKTPVSQEE